MLRSTSSVEASVPKARRGGWLLVAAAALLAAVWLLLLPRVAQQQTVRDTIERNERLGINPAAKFYTELPCMPGMYYQVQRALQRTQPAASPTRESSSLSPSPSGRGPG